MMRKAEHHRPERHQPSLFDEETPLVKPCLARVELASLVEALLREIAATLVQGKDGASIHEQNHG
jgi:hypothetical protein